MSEISVNDLFLIFDKPLESTRYLRAADNEEECGILVYIVSAQPARGRCMTRLLLIVAIMLAGFAYAGGHA